MNKTQQKNNSIHLSNHYTLDYSTLDSPGKITNEDFYLKLLETVILKQ